MAVGQIGSRSWDGFGVEVDAVFQQLVNQMALVAEDPRRWCWLAVDPAGGHGFLRLGGLVEFFEGVESGR